MQNLIELRLGIIWSRSSQWISPFYAVPKSNRNWHPDGDYRAFENASVTGRYPIQRIHDFSDILWGKRIVSKFSLVRAHRYILVTLEDIPKTAITASFGQHEYFSMAFSLRVTTRTLESLMSQVLHGLNFAFLSTEDALIASTDELEHHEHLRLTHKRI